MKKVNIVVFGDSFVGKTAIFKQLTAKTFPNAYTPTEEDESPFPLEYDHNTVEMIIYDTSGNPDFAHLREVRYITGDGFLAVYSVTSIVSFNELQKMVEKLKVLKGDLIPLVLVGCKLDLEDQRQVSTEEGKELAKHLNCPFAEISAKKRDHVVEVFVHLLQEVARISSQSKADSETTLKPNQGQCCMVL